VAAHNQESSKNYFKNKILKEETDNKCRLCKQQGARGGAVVEELHYKPEGREFDTRWCHWNFSLT
jgi:hypothetical protein